MKPIRRKTREQVRHARACVRQALTAPTAAEIRADIEANKARAAQMRRKANREN